MRILADANGKEWSVDLNTFVLQRLRNELKIDLMTIFETDLLKRLMDDIVLAVEVLYWVVKPQADRDNIGPEAFAIAMKGRYAQVHTVLAEEVHDFFSSQDRAKAAILRMAMTSMRTMREKTADKADELVTDQVIERMVESEVQKIFGEFTTSMQGLSASTPPA